MFQHSVFHSFFAHRSNKSWQRAADMASLAAVLSVFDLACRTSLLSLRQLLVFFHFCSKCSIWVKSCQKVEKRRWRGKSKKMRTQKMHMFSHLITFTYLIFRKKKESEAKETFQLICCAHRAVDLWFCEWPMAQVHTQDESMIYNFFCQIPRCISKKKCLKSE